jgi:hypothetical protein
MIDDVLINKLVLYKEECVICFELIDKKVVLNCNHYYCESCIQRWIKMGKYKCPICRYNITDLTVKNKKYNIYQFRHKEDNEYCNKIIIIISCGFFLTILYLVHNSKFNSELNNSELNNSELNNHQIIYG